MGVGRKMRILLVSVGNSSETIKLLSKLLISKSHVVRVCKTKNEFDDMVKKPNCDFGLAIVLNHTETSVLKDYETVKVKILEYYEGRCNVTKLLNDIESEISVLGRY